MSENSGKQSRGELLWFGLIALAVLALLFGGRNSGGNKQIPVGTPLPEFMAAGWLNTEGIPSRENLAGKIVVIDCWATWCPPCRAAMPKLAKLYAKYEPLGVVFIGLTPEPESERRQVKQFIDSTNGFNWPVGYGSRPTIDMLGVSVYPTLIVFGTNGEAIWSSTRLIGIEDALDQALVMAER